jgi:hypothetical protein
MRDDRTSTVQARRSALPFVVGALVGWLVIQNGVLLLLWSWPLWPAFATLARAIFKVAGLLLAPALAAALLAGGAPWLWAVSARPVSGARGLEEVRHG